MSFSFRNDEDPMYRNDFGPWLSTIAILFSLTGVSNNLAAAAWEVKPRVDVGAEYQSNPRFRSNDRETESATGLLVNASLPIGFENSRTQASLTPALRRTFYRKEENQDIERENYFLRGNVGHSLTRSRIGASAGYENLDLASAQFDSGDGSGAPVLRDSREERLNLNPYWSYQLSGANTVGVNGGVSQTRFDQLSLQFFDFDYNNLSAMFNHVFNEKNNLSVRANLAKFDSFQPVTTVENDSTTNGLSAIFTNYFSQSLSFTANLGWARTQSKVTFPGISIPGLGDICPDGTPAPCISESDSTNFVGDLSLQKRSENTQYLASIGQTIAPNSNGSQVIRRTLRGNFNKRFSRNFSAGLNLSAFRQTDVGATDDAGGLNRRRDFANIGANVSWQFRRELALSARYRFTYSDQSGLLLFNPSTVTDHRVFIGLSYKGRGWR